MLPRTEAGVREQAQEQTDVEDTGQPGAVAARAQILLFSVSGSSVDASALGARLAEWTGPGSSVTCSVDGITLPLASDRAASADEATDPVAQVLVASRRATVFASAHRQFAAPCRVQSYILVTDARELRNRLESDDVQVLLLDEDLLRSLDVETSRWLMEQSRRLHTLLLCDRARSCQDGCALARGLRGCLTVDAAPGMWARAISAVTRGELWLPRAVLQQAAAERQAVLPDLPTKGLTPREVEAVALVREGLANKEIARRLGVGEDTIKKHLQHAFAKLGVHRRALVAIGKLDPRGT